MPQKIPYLVRRARLLLGRTQSQFAEMFGVEADTVSRWERGKLTPSTEAYERILEVNRAVLDAATGASPVWKYVARQDALTRPVVVSEGIRQALREFGIAEHELSSRTKQVLPADPKELSCLHALELIQRDPLWLDYRPVYAEVHCLSAHFGWIDAVVAPIPDRSFALVEFARSPQGEEAGFRVRFVHPEDLEKEAFQEKFPPS